MSDQFRWDSGQKDGGVSDHGALTGLGDDDHPQYLNEERHNTPDRHALGSIVPHDDAANLGYSPGVAADWDSGSDPGNVDDALDQLAGRVSNNEAAITGGGDTPSCRIKRSTAQSFANNTLGLTIEFDAEHWDTARIWSAANPERLVAPIDGIYSVYLGSIKWPGTFTSGDIVLSIWVTNSVGTSRIASGRIQAFANAIQSPIYSEIYLEAGDYVQFQVWQNSGATKSFEVCTPYGGDDNTFEYANAGMTWLRGEI